MSKKLLTLVLALMMVVAVFAGCAQKAAETTVEETTVVEEEATEEVTEEATEEAVEEETTEEATEEATEETEETVEPAATIDISETQEVELSCWGIDDAWGEGVEIDKFGQYILDKFNVTITTRNITWGDYTEKANLWAASNDLPAQTTVAIIGGTTYFQWIEEGVVRALPSDDVLQQFPTLWNNLNVSQVADFVGEDGLRYEIPRMTYPNPDWYCMDDGLYYRKDWLANLGLEWPTTEEEFINTCVAFATQDPDGNGQNDTIGLSTLTSTWPLQQGGAFPNYGQHQGCWCINEDGTIYNNGYSEDALPLYSFYRKLQKAGGLDPDFFTHQSDDECTLLFTSGKSGFYSEQTSPTHMNGVYNGWVANQPDKEWWDCVGLAECSDEYYWNVEGVDDNWGRINPSAHWSEWYVGSKVTDEEILRYLYMYDWFASDEGMTFMGYGFEGEDYEYDEDGYMVSLLPTKEDGTASGISDKYTNASCQAIFVWTGDMTQYINPNIPVEIRKWCTEERDRRIAKCPNPNTSYKLNGISTDAKSEMTADTSDWWVNFVFDETDATDEELYAKLLENWNNLGYQAACDSLTEAWAPYNEEYWANR